MHDKDHPIWQIVGPVVMFVWLTLVMVFTVNSFDESEIKTLALFAGGYGSGLVAKKVMQGKSE